MNPLHLSGYGLELLEVRAQLKVRNRSHEASEYEIQGNSYSFPPRGCPYDSIIIENGTGHITLQALRWLSKHNIPVFLLDFDGSIISSILPPTPIKADLRVAQILAANDSKKKFNIAHALVKAKIERSLQVLDWLGQRYDIEREVRMAKGEAAKLGQANTVPEIRTVEGRTALRYWEAFRKVLPQYLGFQGRMVTTKAMNATDPANAALNYSYGFLKCECRMAINAVGLEPAVGYLHEISATQTKESLVYDLEELFRFLCDLCVTEAFESSKLNLSDFAYSRDDYRFRIEWEGRRRLLNSLRQTFNSTVSYKGNSLKWNTIIEEKANELGRYLNGSTPELDFSEPAPILQRQDNREVRERILSLSQSEAGELGIGKSTLHYLRKRAQNQLPFRIYSRVREKMVQSTEAV